MKAAVPKGSPRTAESHPQRSDALQGVAAGKRLPAVPVPLKAAAYHAPQASAAASQLQAQPLRPMVSATLPPRAAVAPRAAGRPTVVPLPSTPFSYRPAQERGGESAASVRMPPGGAVPTVPAALPLELDGFLGHGLRAPAPAAGPAPMTRGVPLQRSPSAPAAEHTAPFQPSLHRVPMRHDTIAVPSASAADGLVGAPPRRSVAEIVRPALRWALYAFAAWLGLVVLLILLYRFVNPPMSALMLQQRVTGTEINQTWVDLDSVSPQIVRAVLVSEDGRFCEHWGVDFEAMWDALERVGEGNARGASTISMQVVKNLFLWPSKSYVRKAIELPLTWLMEFVWPKRRIMEVYLNIAEWGPGIFGVEAASRYHFNKSARRLNEFEAARLAVALPNPYLRDAGDPGPKTQQLAREIQTRMRRAYRGQTSCVLNVRR